MVAIGVAATESASQETGVERRAKGCIVRAGVERNSLVCDQVHAKRMRVGRDGLSNGVGCVRWKGQAYTFAAGKRAYHGLSCGTRGPVPAYEHDWLSWGCR